MASYIDGPWMVTTENRGAIPEHFRLLVVTTDGGGQVIARMPDGRAPYNCATAALIADAPDMFDCLRGIVHQIDNHGEIMGLLMADIRAIVARHDA